MRQYILKSAVACAMLCLAAPAFAADGEDPAVRAMVRDLERLADFWIPACERVTLAVGGARDADAVETSLDALAESMVAWCLPLVPVHGKGWLLARTPAAKAAQELLAATSERATASSKRLLDALEAARARHGNRIQEARDDFLQLMNYAFDGLDETTERTARQPLADARAATRLAVRCAGSLAGAASRQELLSRINSMRGELVPLLESLANGLRGAGGSRGPLESRLRVPLRRLDRAADRLKEAYVAAARDLPADDAVDEALEKMERELRAMLK